MKEVVARIHRSHSLTKAYQRLVGEDEARYCKDIPDSACNSVPANFFITLLANFLTRLGDALVDAKTVLPWLLTGLGAPAALIGLLVPIRESGSLLPQMFIAGVIRRLAVRKWVWVAGSLAAALSVPYYVAIARQRSDDIALSGLFVIASGAAGLLSGPFWGRLADRSSHRVLILCALLTGLLGALALAATLFARRLPEIHS